MISLLLPELIETILDHLVETSDGDLHYHSSSSLKAVSLVCRSLVAPSQSRLFATISLGPPPPRSTRHGGGRETIFISTRQLKESSIAAFSRVTAASPHQVLGYVRRLNLYGSPYPLDPPLPPALHTDWLSSQSHHLATFIPNLAPRMRGFGIYDVDWNTLSPEVLDAISSILRSSRLTSLTLNNTMNIPIPVLASCAHLQHFTLRNSMGGYDSTVKPPNTWDDAALTWGPSSNHQKLQLISLKLLAEDSIIDWFSMENCLFDISHLRHLALLRAGQDFTKFFQTCSSSLESFTINVELNCYLPKDYDALNISSLTRLRKAQFSVPIITIPSRTDSKKPQNPLSWVNELLIRQSRMSALEELILNCVFFEPIASALPLFSQTDSILACGEVFPALRFVTVLLNVTCLPQDDVGRDKFNGVETIKMEMPLLSDMGFLSVN